MKATYYMKLDELTPEFINNLKKQFKNAFVEIFLKEMDETDYLNLSEKNRRLLEKSIKEIEENKIIIKSKEELGI